MIGTAISPGTTLADVLSRSGVKRKGRAKAHVWTSVGGGPSCDDVLQEAVNRIAAGLWRSRDCGVFNGCDYACRDPWDDDGVLCGKTQSNPDVSDQLARH